MTNIEIMIHEQEPIFLWIVCFFQRKQNNRTCGVLGKKTSASSFNMGNLLSNLTDKDNNSSLTSLTSNSSKCYEPRLGLYHISYSSLTWRIRRSQSNSSHFKIFLINYLWALPLLSIFICMYIWLSHTLDRRMPSYLRNQLYDKLIENHGIQW